jgi:hypothetical protein
VRVGSRTAQTPRNSEVQWAAAVGSAGFHGEERLDLGDLAVAKAKVSGPRDLGELARPPRTHDGAGHGRMTQHPGHGDLGGRPALGPTDGMQQAHQPQVVGQLWLLVVGAAPPPVVGRQGGHPLRRHRAGQQARRHRRVGDHADAAVVAERQDFLPDLTPD